MPQLTALDAQFLHFETATNIANIAGLAILDGDLNRADLQALLERRLPYVPALRRKLAFVPLGLDHPYWVQEDDLDLDYHVREIGLPPPGGDRQPGDPDARPPARRRRAPAGRPGVPAARPPPGPPPAAGGDLPDPRPVRRPHGALHQDPS